MCEFCDVLVENRGEKLSWYTRSTFADNNLEEYLEEKSGYKENYLQNHSSFQIFSSKWRGNILFGVGYREEISNRKDEKVIISPFSESIYINYCPMCGKQLTEETKSTKECLRGMVKLDESI